MKGNSTSLRQLTPEQGWNNPTGSLPTTQLRPKSNGTVGAQVCLLEGPDMEMVEGRKWALTRIPPYWTGEIIFLLVFSVTESGTEKQILLIKNINTYHSLDITPSVSCVFTYLIAGINCEVGTIGFPTCDWGNRGLMMMNKWISLGCIVGPGSSPDQRVET